MSLDHPVIEFSLLGWRFLSKGTCMYVEWWPIFVFMGIHCWAGAFLVNLYFIDEWRLLTCKQVPSLLQLHTSNVIKAFPVSRKLTPLLQQIHLGFSGGYAYTYQQYTPLGTLSMQRNTLLGVYMENAEKELFLWHGVVKSKLSELPSGLGAFWHFDFLFVICTRAILMHFTICFGQLNYWHSR